MLDRSERIRVVIADDHPVYREGLALSLNATGKIHVVAQVSNGRDALDAIRQLEPAVALVDYQMPGLDGLAVVKAVEREGLKKTKVVMLSATHDDPSVYNACAAGAAGYIGKESDRDEIADAVIECAKGSGYLPNKLTGGLIRQVKQRSSSEPSLLTSRESEIIQFIAQGMSVPQIALKLHIGQSTVKTHVQNLYDKLGVSDRAAAVAAAMRRGLVA